MIVIASNNKSYDLALPTDTREITNDAINKLAAKIHIAKNYVLVGLITPTQYIRLQAMFGRNGRDDKSFVMPIIAKIGKEDSETSGFEVGETVVISRTALEMGNHVDGFNNPISPRAIYEYIRSDKEVLKRANIDEFTQFYTLTFKIVPLNNIVAVYKKNVVTETPFVSYRGTEDKQV